MDLVNVRFKLISRDKFFDSFQNEPINYVQKVADFTRIGESYSDFIFSFSLPATINNLSLIDFYNDPLLENGFDPKEPTIVEMYTNEDLYSTGTMELVTINRKNRKPDSITFQFFADSVNLKTALRVNGSDTMISELADSWVKYNHVSNPADVLAYLQGDPVLGDGGFDTGFKYPMASQENILRWGGPPREGQRRIASLNTGTQPTDEDVGILNTEARPAMRVSDLLDQIFLTAGFDYQVKFAAAEYYSDLWFWIANGKDYNNNILSYDTRVFLGSNQSFHAGNARINWNVVSVDNLNLYSTVTDAYTVAVDGTYTSTLFFKGTFVENLEWRIMKNGIPVTGYVTAIEDTPILSTLFGLVVDDQIYIEMRNLLSIAKVGRLTANSFWNFGNGQLQPIDELGVAAYFPTISCIDYLNGILMTFDAVLYWDKDEKKYVIDHRTAWLNAGKKVDLTDEIDTSADSIAPPKFFRSYGLGWQDPLDYLNTGFIEANNERIYGADKFITGYKYGVDYEQINPFTNTVWQEIVSVNSGNVPFNFSDMPSFQAVDADSRPIDPGVRLMFFEGVKTAFGNYTTSDGITPDPVGATTYNRFVPLNKDWDMSLGYRSEYDWKVPATAAQLMPFSLYSYFFADYIASIYDHRVRRYAFDFYLPYYLIQGLRLNDEVIIQGESYMIDQANVNFLTGRVKMQLMDKVVFPAITKRAIYGRAFDGIDQYMDLGIVPLINASGEFVEIKIWTANALIGDIPFGFTDSVAFPASRSFFINGIDDTGDTDVAIQANSSTADVSWFAGTAGTLITLKFGNFGQTFVDDVVVGFANTNFNLMVQSTINFFVGARNNQGVALNFTDCVLVEAIFPGDVVFNVGNNWNGATNNGGTDVKSLDGGVTWIPV